MLADIPAPEVLSPDRVSRDDSENMTAEDHRSQKQLLATALEETCAYAGQLWHNLSAMRQYLYDSLPQETPEPGVVVSATPHGTGDEDGWQRWRSAFGSTTSVLCGPHGDSGFGSQDAAVLAQHARQLVVTLPAAGSEVSSGAPDVDAESDHDANGMQAADEERTMHFQQPASPVIDPVLAAVGKPLLYALAGAMVTVLTMRRTSSRS